MAAEHGRCCRVSVVDRPMHHLELGDVVLRGSQPGQADIVGLVVALPEAHPAVAVACQAVHELVVGVRILGRRRRDEVGRFGCSHGAGAEGDPDLLGAVELVQKRIDHLEGVVAWLGFDLRPVDVDAQSRAQLAELRHKRVGLSEESVANAADDPQADASGITSAITGNTRLCSIARSARCGSRL